MACGDNRVKDGLLFLTSINYIKKEWTPRKTVYKLNWEVLKDGKKH